MSVLDERWKQFSLYPFGCRNKFQPQQVLHTFLPRFLAETSLKKWHVLFEPSALIRFVSAQPAVTFREAVEISEKCGLILERGDCSAKHIKGHNQPDEDFCGRLTEYDEESWDVLTKYMQACGEWSLVISKLETKKQFEMTRKGVHLTLNALGLNYLEESTLCNCHADRCVELMLEYYRM